jgi:hypothetical protein
MKLLVTCSKTLHVFHSLHIHISDQTHFDKNQCALQSAICTVKSSVCSTSLHVTSLHFNSLRFAFLHFTLIYFTSLHFTSLHFTPLHFTSYLFRVTVRCKSQNKVLQTSSSSVNTVSLLSSRKQDIAVEETHLETTSHNQTAAKLFKFCLPSHVCLPS